MSDIKASRWFNLHRSDQHIWLALPAGPHRVLSSCVLNGGLVHADHVLNLKVPRQLAKQEQPAHTLQSYADGLGAGGTTVGMMTAASMASLRCYRQQVQGVELTVLVTCGLDNARRVGDTAEYQQMITSPVEVGTINIVCLSSVGLTEAAMVEAVQMITEAKTAALVNAGIRSPLTCALATGTGTDAVAVVSAKGREQVQYCGKHVLFGEILGQLVLGAVQDSIGWYRQGETDSQVDT